MSAAKKDVTTLLHLASRGDRQAQDELFRLVEGELRKRAEAYLSREQPSPALQTTVLIDEAFLKLVGDQSIHWENRAHFYCWAARAMRQILVDSIRQRKAAKRGGGGRPESLDRVPEPIARKSLDPPTVLALHDALAQLAADRPDLALIVELHVFGGWTLKQIATDILGLPGETVKNRWQQAKALLREAINGGGHDA